MGGGEVGQHAPPGTGSTQAVLQVGSRVGWYHIGSLGWQDSFAGRTYPFLAEFLQ